MTDLWGDIFWMYVAKLSSSAHSLYGSDFSCNMEYAISFRDLFFHLATLFCCGVQGTVCYN
jgi:hypothetical protein